MLEQDGDTLFLQSVVCKKKTAMKKILKRIITKKETEKFARNIKTKAEFLTWQRKYALSEKSIQRILRCTAADGKNTDQYKNGKTAMEEPPVCLLHFLMLFFRFFLAF